MIIYWKDRIKKYAYLLLALAVLINSSCKKENNEIGSDVIGDRSGFDVQVTDTFEVITYSTKADSVDTRFLTYYMLGQINDPIMGITTTNIVTQFLYPVAGFSFANQTIDSVVLQLRYAGASGIYGKNTNQTFKVYEITEDLPTSLNEYFYSNRNYQTSPMELGSYSGKLNLTDSVIEVVNGKRLGYAPQMRINITDPTFINKLKNTPIDSFASSATFKSSFKGFMISSEQNGMASGDGAIAYFNLRTDNPQTALVVYCTKDAEQVKYEFPISGTSEVKTNQYKHTNLPASLQGANNGAHQTTCYLQPAAGIKTRILIPNLSKIAESNQIAVNSARIFFTVKDTAGYPVPERLNLWDAEADGGRKMIADFSESEAYYGGRFNRATGTYTFNINRYVQQLLTSYNKNKVDVNYGLNLFVPEDYNIAANRAVLNTDRSIPGQEKVKLILTYTVIK